MWFLMFGPNAELFCGCATGASAMPMNPVGADELRRAARRAGSQLQADRVILQETRNRRETLLAAFDRWLAENWRLTLEELLTRQPLDCEEVLGALVAYGKEMYNSGKSYGHFSETINAEQAKRSALRRSLTSAWDLAFNRVADEPHEHHSTLPLSIVIGCVTLLMLWVWLEEAAIIALTWAGVLLVGESFAAVRGDLVFPCDAAPGVVTALLKIRLPKTPEDPLQPEQPTSRKSHVLAWTEDAEYVRRKGR